MTPTSARSDADRRSRERALKRSKAVAAAAGVGGFASLVAVLIAHPAHSTSKTATTTTRTATSTVQSGTSTSDDSSVTTVTPDTVTSGS